MRVSSQESTRVQEILNVIYGISKPDKNERAVESEDALFSRVCDIVKCLNPREFGELEEKLLLYLVLEWHEVSNCCFLTLEFISDVFSYICSISDLDIVKECLFYFSKPSMPPHIRLIIYPAILDVANRRFPDRSFFKGFNFMQVFEKCVQKLSKNIDNSTNEFITFWKCALHHYRMKQKSKVHNCQLLTAFVTSRCWFERLCIIDEHRISMFKNIVQCVVKKPQEKTSVLLSSLFVIYLQSVKFNENSWKGMSLFLQKLIEMTSHHSDPTIIEFVSSTITNFLSCVDVTPEHLITDFKSTSFTLITVNSLEKSQNPLLGNPTPSIQSTKPVTQNGNLSKYIFSRRSSANGHGQQEKSPNKTLQIIATYVQEMKDSTVKLELEADRQLLQKLVNDMSSFL